MEFFNRCISIRRLSLPVLIGFHHGEVNRAQRVLIDIELRLAPVSQALPDDVSSTVDYDTVYQGMPTLVANRHFKLQETLCHEILAFCAKLEGVASVRVWVRKPDIYGDCESAGYEAEASASR